MVVVLVTATIGWLMSSRAPSAEQRQGDEYVLGYGRQWQLFARLSFVGPAFIGVFALRESRSGDVLPYVLIGGFTALVVWLNLEMRRQVRVSVRGIRMIPPLGRPVAIPWRNIEQLRWRSTKREFQLCAQDGRTIEVPQAFSGLATLGEHIAKHLPHVHDAADARVLLSTL